MERQDKHRRNKEEEGIIAYLLGTLPEAESDRFEERYLEDAALFQQMQEIEDELIDDYAGGTLAQEERIRFEQHFLLLPDRFEKVRFAVAMTGRAKSWQTEKKATTSSALSESSTVISREATESKGNVLSFTRWRRPVPAWREWGAIAAAVLIAIGAGGLWLRNRGLRQEVLTAKTEEARLQEQVRSESARADLAETRSAEKDTSVQTVIEPAKNVVERTRQVSRLVVKAVMGVDDLLRITRGTSIGKVNTLKVPSSASEIQLDLEFEGTAFESFTAKLFAGQDVNVKPTWSSPKIFKGTKSSQDRQKVTITIPARGLSPGDFQLVISAYPQSDIEVARYRLQIVRQQ